MPDSFWIWYCVPSAKWHITLKAESQRFSRQSLCAMESRRSNTVKMFYTNYFFKCICLSSVSLMWIFAVSVERKKKKKKKESRRRSPQTKCDCVTVSCGSRTCQWKTFLWLVCIAFMFFHVWFPSCSFCLRVCNAQNVNFFCIHVLLDIHFLQTLV